MKHVKFLLAAIVMTVPTQSLGDSSYSITFINIELEKCKPGFKIKFRRCLERNDKKLKSAIETLNKDANKLKKRLKTLTTEVSNLETSIETKISNLEASIKNTSGIKFTETIRLQSKKFPITDGCVGIFKKDDKNIISIASCDNEESQLNIIKP